MSQLKVFYWDSVGALMDYSYGRIIAFASSKEEAIELAVQEYEFYCHHCSASHKEELLGKLRQELATSNAFVYDSPQVFIIWGSN